MDKKIEKYLRNASIAFFLFALFTHTSVSINDPLVLTSNVAVADTVSTTTSSQSSAGVWRKIVDECTASKSTYSCCPPKYVYEDVPGHSLGCTKTGSLVRCVPHSCIMGSECTQQ